MQQGERENAMEAAPEAAGEEELVVARSSSSSSDHRYRSDHDDACWATYGRRNRCRLPPPMPGLASTARFASRAPWALRRTYEDDGGRRLVIQEVPAQRHEYLRARREDGRLTLHRMEWTAAASAFEREIEEMEGKGSGGDGGEGSVGRTDETSASAPSSSTATLAEDDRNCGHEEDGRSTTGSAACPKDMEELRRAHHHHIPSLSIRSASCSI